MVGITLVRFDGLLARCLGFLGLGLTFRPMTPRQAMEGIAVAMAGYRRGRGFGGGPARQT